jgi:2-dehydropantoate 2-reductase
MNLNRDYDRVGFAKEFFNVMGMILVGAGQVGGIIGARLVRAGHEMTFCDVDREHVEAIRTAGLRVDLPADSFTVRPKILMPSEVSGQFDLVMMAVRSEGTEDVLNSMARHLSENATVVSLQNGMNLPLVAGRVGADRAIGAVVRMRSIKVAPGHVRTHQNGYLYIGHIHGRPTPQLNALHDLLNPVMPTKIADNMYGVMWSKLTFTSLRMLSWIADAKMPVIWASEANRRLFAEFITEIIKVGAAAAARFEKLAEYDPNDFHPNRSLEQRMSTVEEMARSWKEENETGGGLKRGEKTEVDGIIGAVIREGKRLGIPTPLCQAALQVYGEVENHRRPIGMQNYQELYSLVNVD